MSIKYDANQNIIDTEGDDPVIGNRALYSGADPQGAPNAFTSSGGPKTAAFSVQTTNGSGQITSVVTNPS